VYDVRCFISVRKILLSVESFFLPVFKSIAPPFTTRAKGPASRRQSLMNFGVTLLPRGRSSQLQMGRLFSRLGTAPLYGRGPKRSGIFVRMRFYCIRLFHAPAATHADQACGQTIPGEFWAPDGGPDLRSVCLVLEPRANGRSVNTPLTVA